MLQCQSVRVLLLYMVCCFVAHMISIAIFHVVSFYAFLLKFFCENRIPCHSVLGSLISLGVGCRFLPEAIYIVKDNIMPFSIQMTNSMHPATSCIKRANLNDYECQS